MVVRGPRRRRHDSSDRDRAVSTGPRQVPALLRRSGNGTVAVSRGPRPLEAAPAGALGDVLYGPRGNGKTALLLWLERFIEQQAGLEVIRLSPSSYRDSKSLTEAIVREPVWRKLLPQRFSPRWFTRAAQKRETPEFETALARRVSRKPLAMLLDEAHWLEPALGRPVLNASQQVGRRLPFLLVLAGTPDLPARLNAPGASFWNRCEQRRIGRLDAEATAAALSEPLRAEGFSIVPAALERLVRGESRLSLLRPTPRRRSLEANRRAFLLRRSFGFAQRSGGGASEFPGDTTALLSRPVRRVGLPEPAFGGAGGGGGVCEGWLGTRRRRSPCGGGARPREEAGRRQDRRGGARSAPPRFHLARRRGARPGARYSQSDGLCARTRAEATIPQ